LTSVQGKVLAGDASHWGNRPRGEETMQAVIQRFLKSEDGPTATEYAVMLALIIIVALAAITSLGTKVSGIFSTVDSSLTTAT
jgi:pilus assembly protein Flp/PilA